MQTTASVRSRITSVDYARGVIMLIMAIDHLRDFFHITALTADPLNVNTTTPAVFFTRWITHFCAPAFLFLSGMSVWLSAQNKDRSSASAFLIKRGLFIALFDIVVMSFLLSFDPHYSFVFITVFWAIGCSMILLGLFMRFAPKLILPIGLLIFFGHDTVTTWLRSDPNAGNGLLRVLFTGIYFLPVTSNNVLGFLYSILPWTSVMFLGYAAAPLLNNTKKLLTVGIGLLILFIVLRCINSYGDLPWQTQSDGMKTFLAFLNVSKYPPSLQFLCVTLSGICIFLALARNSSNAFKRFAAVYGRVPFFFFVMHFLIGHVLVVILFYATGHTNAEIVDSKTGIWFRPQNFGVSLAAMYGIWALVVLLLYYPSKWFFALKKRSDSWVLKYV